MPGRRPPISLDRRDHLIRPQVGVALEHQFPRPAVQRPEGEGERGVETGGDRSCVVCRAARITGGRSAGRMVRETCDRPPQEMVQRSRFGAPEGCGPERPPPSTDATRPAGRSSSSTAAGLAGKQGRIAALPAGLRRGPTSPRRRNGRPVFRPTRRVLARRNRRRRRRRSRSAAHAGPG